MPATPVPELGGIPHCDPEGRLWVATPGFVGFWDGTRWVAVLEGSWMGQPGGDSAAGPARDGRLWFVRGSWLLKVGVGGVVRQVRLSRAIESPWALQEDSGGNVWVPSWRRGLYHVDVSALDGEGVAGAEGDASGGGSRGGAGDPPGSVADVEGVAGEFERHGNLVLGPHGIRLAVSAEMEDGCPQACGPLFLGLFRIVKEALANVVKHSGASSVEVRVVASRDGLVLAIGDDGRGLPAGCGKGRGLLSMRRRAEELGGKMTLDSGAGLRLLFSVPWPGHDAGRANEARRGTDLRPPESPA